MEKTPVSQSGQPIKSPLLRYHGGKWKIAPWIINHFPRHDIYVEPFGGGGSVLFRKRPCRAEIYNDLDNEIVNVFRVIRDQLQADQLSTLCLLTPYSRSELGLSNEPSNDPVEQARRTLFRAWSGFGSAGATRGRTGFRTYTKPNKRYTPVTSSWARVPDIIKEVTERLRNVIIENRPAIEIMQQHDTPQTLHYVDPPYLPETRSFEGGRYYRHEMGVEDHIELLETVKSLKGHVLISGYDSALYNETLAGWVKKRHKACASSRFGSVQRSECLWIKPTPGSILEPHVFTPKQMELFS